MLVFVRLALSVITFNFIHQNWVVINILKNLRGEETNPPLPFPLKFLKIIEKWENCFTAGQNFSLQTSIFSKNQRPKIHFCSKFMNFHVEIIYFSS